MTTNTTTANTRGPALAYIAKLTTAPAKAPEVVTPFSKRATAAKMIVTTAACNTFVDPSDVIRLAKPKCKVFTINYLYLRDPRQLDVQVSARMRLHYIVVVAPGTHSLVLSPAI